MIGIRRKNIVEISLWALLVIQVVCIGLLAAVPPISRDALTHHLAVPKLWLAAGGIGEIPDVIFSYYPMNIDMLYLISLYFGNDIVPKYIHFAFGLLTAWLIHGFLRNRTGKSAYGLLGVLLFLSLPVIVKLSITVYVDLGLVFFSTAALLSLLKWADEGYRLRHLLIGAVACGLALGTKYNGLITFFLLVCFIPPLYLRGRSAVLSRKRVDSHRIKADSQSERFASLHALCLTAAFAAVALVVFSPWMIRNLHWTGNPIYPLYQGIFSRLEPHPPAAETVSGDARESDDSSGHRPLSHFSLRKLIYRETFLETMSIPVRIFFQGRDNDPRYFDGKLNPYLLFFPLLAFLNWKKAGAERRRDLLALAGFSILFLLYAFFKVDMRIRYVAPIIPPLVILTALGFENAATFVRSKMKGRRKISGVAALCACMGLLVGLNAHYIVKQFKIVTPLAYLNGQIDRDDYIQKFRPEYAAMRYINQHLPPGAKILAVYLGNRIYYSDRPIICDDDFIKTAIQSAPTAESLMHKLAVSGFTHLLIRNSFVNHFIFEQLSPEKRELTRRFFETKTVGLFSKNDHSVIELKKALAQDENPS